jgi:hypothetical protein
LYQNKFGNECVFWFHLKLIVAVRNFEKAPKWDEQD